MVLNAVLSKRVYEERILESAAAKRGSVLSPSIFNIPTLAHVDTARGRSDFIDSDCCGHSACPLLVRSRSSVLLAWLPNSRNLPFLVAIASMCSFFRSFAFNPWLACNRDRALTQHPCVDPRPVEIVV